VTLENIYVVIPSYAGTAYCKYNSAYYYFYNIPDAAKDQQLYNAYCISERLVSS
jgi:hypothetical protein